MIPALHRDRTTRWVSQRDPIAIALVSTATSAYYLHATEFPPGQRGWWPWQVLMVLSLGGLLLMTRLRALPFPRSARAPVLLWVLFALAALVSTILHGASQPQALWYLVGVPLFLMNMLPLLFGQRTSLILACSVVVAYLTLVVLSFAFVPITLGLAYKGILQYHTSMGTVCTMAVAATLGLLDGALSHGPAGRRPAIFLSCVLLSALVVGTTTAYRTGIATSLLLIAMFGAANYRRASCLIRSFAVFTAIVLAVGVTSFGESLRFWDAVVAKQQYRMEADAGGATSYRDEQARATILNARWFGYGTQARAQDAVNTIIGYHSSFTMVLGQYGIAAVVFFIGFWATSLVAVRRYIHLARDTDPYRQVPFLLVAFFMLFTLGSKVMSPWATGPMLPVLVAAGSALMHDAVHRRTQEGPTATTVQTVHDGEVTSAKHGGLDGRPGSVAGDGD